MKKFIEYFAVGLFATMLLAGLQKCDRPKAKYTVYTADRKYGCNNFTISGGTLYFDDIDGRRVFINGSYSLVYEKEVSEE